MGMCVCVVLAFWYWLTQVVLEKRPLNGCGSSSSISSSKHAEEWHTGPTELMFQKIRPRHNIQNPDPTTTYDDIYTYKSGDVMHLHIK